MHDQDLAIVKALVSVAWADGVFAEREREMLDALLDAYGAEPSEREAVNAYAALPRTLDDIDPQDLSADDRRVLLQHAVLLMHADGVPHDSERKLLDALCEKVRIPAVEAKGIIEAAERRAREMG